MKLAQKEAAIRLRKQGESLKAISRDLGIAKSTISIWVRDVPLSKKAKQRIEKAYTDGQRASQIAIRARTAKRLLCARTEARELVSSLALEPGMSLLLCSLLYWCEGGKSKNDDVLTFTNSDPLLIQAYMGLLRGSVAIDESKFRAVMHLHSYHNEQAQQRFWSTVTGIPADQFQKSYVKQNSGKRVRNGYPGCVHIKYYDVKLARKVAATARAALQKVVEKSVQGP